MLHDEEDDQHAVTAQPPWEAAQTKSSTVAKPDQATVALARSLTQQGSIHLHAQPSVAASADARDLTAPAASPVDQACLASLQQIGIDFVMANDWEDAIVWDTAGAGASAGAASDAKSMDTSNTVVEVEDAFDTGEHQSMLAHAWAGMWLLAYKKHKMASLCMKGLMADNL